MTTPYVVDASGISAGQTIQPAHLLNNYNAIATSISSGNTDIDANTAFRNASQTASYVEAVVTSGISTSANTITIAANSLIFYDLPNLQRVTIWPSASLTGLQNNTSGYLHATYIATTPGWQTITNYAAIPNQSNSFPVATYSVDGSGVVTLSYAQSTVPGSSTTFYKETQTFLRPAVFNAGLSGPNKLPANYLALGRYTYQSANQINIAGTYAKDSTNTLDLEIANSITVDLTVNGLNGCVVTAQTGTVNVNSGAAAVVGTGTTFTTNYVVGDVIRTAGGQGRRITTITDNTNIVVESNWTTTETGVGYSRGGKAPNTWYYLYLTATDAYKGTGYVFSPRNVAGGATLIDLPTAFQNAAYTKFRQLPVAVRLDNNNSIIPFTIRENRTVLWSVPIEDISIGTISVTAGGSTVTGVLTTFLTAASGRSNVVGVGTTIVTQGGQIRTVTAVASNTSLTVNTPFTSSEAAVTYSRASTMLWQGNALSTKNAVDIDASRYVPAIARVGNFWTAAYDNGCNMYMRPKGSGGTGVAVNGNNGASTSYNITDIGLNASQVAEMYVDDSPIRAYVCVAGYTVTEV